MSCGGFLQRCLGPASEAGSAGAVAGAPAAGPADCKPLAATS